VKWTGSRSEFSCRTSRGGTFASTSELALDAREIPRAALFVFADLGAYLRPHRPFHQYAGRVACLTGVLRGAGRLRQGQVAVTNKAPGAAYRGAGRPVMSVYLLERLVDQAAVELASSRRAAPQEPLVTQDKVFRIRRPTATPTTAADSRACAPTR